MTGSQPEQGLSPAQGSTQYVSHFSHVGGFICGLVPSFLFLPNLQDKRWGSAWSAGRSRMHRPHKAASVQSHGHM